MAKYLDSAGLSKYDELIKGYIDTNGGKIDIVKTKTPSNTTATALSISSTDKSVTVDLSGYLTGIKVGSANLLPSSGVATITATQLINAIGEASTSVAGVMSKTDKANLDTLVALLGTEGGDSDTVVNTIREVLAIFTQYGEGTTIANALAGKVDNVTLNSYYTKTQVDEKVASVDLSGYVPTSRTINGRALSADIWVEMGAAWSSGSTYYIGDCVQYTNSGVTGLYYCKKNHSATSSLTPTNTENWTLLAVSNNATTSAKGLMTSAMVTKLNGIATGATADSAITTSEIEALFA